MRSIGEAQRSQVRVEVTEDVTGRWWCYLSRKGEERRVIGRRFASSVEAAAWGLNKAQRYKAGEKEQ
jgi:hypothetical protein